MLDHARRRAAPTPQHDLGHADAIDQGSSYFLILESKESRSRPV